MATLCDEETGVEVEENEGHRLRILAWNSFHRG
jgi:hypothetical protein